MQKTVIIYDASLLADANVAQQYRTGLYRVSLELLRQFMASNKYQIWLYDTGGRERHLRNECKKENIHGINFIPHDNVFYQFFAYRALNAQERCRDKELKSLGVTKWCYKLLKKICGGWGRLCGKVCHPLKLILPNNTEKYISTYYPIPEWVHANAISAVLLVHDLIPLHHPEWFPTKLNEHLLQKVIHSVNNEDSVVCVSEATKRDFQYYNAEFPVERISVAYEAAAEVFTPKVLSEKLKNKLAIDKNHYFLSVCTLEKRKNLQVVVQAYRLLLEQNSDVPKLVLTGAKGWKTGDLYEQIKDINSRFGTKVVLSGYVNDEELAELYSNCVAFVYPSLYEGFGLPPLEAMQCGAPVITSNVSSLPEVVADAGILINPNDAQELAKAMWQISSHDSEQHRIRSMSRAKEFSWEKMANVIMRTI